MKRSALLRKRTVLGYIRILLLLAPVSVLPVRDANSWPWQSCDQRWENAWKQCRGCAEILPSQRPSCEPQDLLLKSYPQGRDDPRHRAKLANDRAQLEARKKRERENIVIENMTYHYTDELANVGQAVYRMVPHFSASFQVYNADPVKTLYDIIWQCNITINNAVELYSGYVRASPSLLPQRRATFEVKFQGKRIPTFDLSRPLYERYEWRNTIPLNNHRIQSLTYRCNPIVASLW